MSDSTLATCILSMVVKASDQGVEVLTLLATELQFHWSYSSVYHFEWEISEYMVIWYTSIYIMIYDVYKYTYHCIPSLSGFTRLPVTTVWLLGGTPSFQTHPDGHR